MHKKISTNKYGKKYEYYICSTYRQKSRKICTIHKIKIDTLEKVILKAIQIHIEKYCEIEKVLEEIKKIEIKNNKNELNKTMIYNKEKQIKKIEEIKLGLYEDWKEKNITKEEYISYKEKYNEDINKLRNNIKKIEKEMQKENQRKENNWIAMFEEKRNISELTRDILEELIEKIDIYENNQITIKFKFNK